METATEQTDRASTLDKDENKKSKFVFEVEGVVYEHDRPKITGAEIMAIAEIPASDGIVQILEDGTTKTIAPTDEVKLVPGTQIRRRPKFKRG